MDRSIHSVTGRIGGIEITATPVFRRRLRRFSRACGAVIGAGCGIAAAVLLAKAAAESPYLWWIAGLGAMCAVQALGWRKSRKS